MISVCIYLASCNGCFPPQNTTMNFNEDDVLCFPRKSSWTKLCPLVGSGILETWIILKTIRLCLVDWTSQGNVYPQNLGISSCLNKNGTNSYVFQVMLVFRGDFFCFPKTNKQKPTGGKSKSVPSAHTRQVQYKLQGFYRFVQHWQGNLDEKTPWDEKTWGGSEGRGLLRSPGMWWFVAPDSVILFLGGGRELRS